MITSLFAPHRALEVGREKIRQAINNTAKRCALPPATSLPDRVAVGKPLIENLIALDADIEYAAAESAQFRIHADGARSLLAHLFATISAKRSMEAHLQRVGAMEDRELANQLESAMALLGTVQPLTAQDRWDELQQTFLSLRAKLKELTPEDSGLSMEQAVSSRCVIDRLDDLFRHLERAIHDLEWLHKGWRWEPSMSLNFHRDQRVAWINGVRAFLAIAAAGTLWVASAWSSGSLMLIQVSVACSLFSSAPKPQKAGTDFFWGGFIASIAAFICNFYVLINLTGFPLLCLVYGVFLIPGAMAFLNPKYSLIGLAYCVIFLATSRPLNPMDYDVVSFINNAVATQVGVGFGVVSYLLFMPPNRDAARRYVVHRIRRGLQIISQREPMPAPSEWQTRMFDRINRFHDRDNPSGTTTDEWLEGGLGAINLGNEVLRLRMLLAEGNLAPPLETKVRDVLKSFGKLVKQPDAAEVAVEQALGAIRQTPPDEDKEKRRAWCRALGGLGEMKGFFIEYPRFLNPSWKRENHA